MLDPLTALSIASSIVQFVDYGSKLLSKSYELYESADGTTIGNAELEVIAKDLQDLNEWIQCPLRPRLVCSGGAKKSDDVKVNV